MELHDVKKEIKKIMTSHRVGTLSTMKGDQPFSRFMIFKNEDFILYTISSKKTEKVQDILANPHVHILLGFDQGISGKPFIDIVANATIHGEKDLRYRLWHDNFLKYLDGPDDPNYIVIRCEPKTIRLMNHPQLDEPFTIHFSSEE